MSSSFAYSTESRPLLLVHSPVAEVIVRVAQVTAEEVKVAAKEVEGVDEVVVEEMSGSLVSAQVMSLITAKLPYLINHCLVGVSSATAVGSQSSLKRSMSNSGKV